MIAVAPVASVSLGAVLVVGITVILACAIGAVVAILGVDVRDAVPKRRSYPIIEREKDIAAGLGWPWKRWVVLRVSAVLIGTVLGILSHIVLLIFVGFAAGLLAIRFIFAGRAANRRLKMERAFLQQLRNLRDRMSISNQSLDTALQEIGRNPGKDLDYVLSPLARGGSVVNNIVEAGMLSRSPIVEYACGVLLWARSRSLDTLIQAIDEILLPVGDAQLAVQEESLVTLSQQRAVTFAMTALMLFMFFVVIRVDVFSSYYQSLQGNIILGVVIVIFAGLVGSLGLITRVQGWTRWDLRKLAHEQERLGV